MLGFMRGNNKQEPQPEDPPIEFKRIGGAQPGAAAAPVQPVVAQPAAAATVGGQPTGPPVVNSRTVQTLLGRVQSSTVAQDRREALDELTLLPAEEVARYMETDNVAMLLNKLRVFIDDEAVSCAILELLTNVIEALRNKLRDEDTRTNFLNELMDLNVFVSFLKTGSFWPKYHSVQMLIALQECDSLKMQRQLLEAHGVDALVDVLNFQDGALRVEGLQLLNSMAMADQDIQSILAFNDCYDSLFRIIEEENGIFGGQIVVDCLMLMTHMLRAKNAAMLFYQGEGFRTVHLNNVLMSPFKDENLNVQEFERNIGNVLLFALRVLTAVIDGSDKSGMGDEVRKVLCTDGYPKSLVSLALTGRLESFVNIEALRAVNLILKGNYKPFADALLNVAVKNEEGKGSKPTISWIFGLLKIAILEKKDTSRQSAAITSLVSLIQAGGMNTALLLVRGFSVATPASSPAGGAPTNSLLNQECGKLLAAALFQLPLGGVTLAPTGRYHAAMLLNQCITLPQVAEQLQSLQVSLDGTATNVTSLLKYYAAQVRTTIQENRADLATLSALMRPLFTWLRFSTKALMTFLEEESHFDFFATWSTNTRNPLHLQLFCGSICVLSAAMCPEQLPETVKLTRADIFNKVYTVVKLRSFADIFYNVGTTTEWQHAPEGYTGDSSQGTALYDATFKGILNDLYNYVQSILQSQAAAQQADPEQQSPQAAAAAASPQQVEVSPEPTSKENEPQSAGKESEAKEESPRKEESDAALSPATPTPAATTPQTNSDNSNGSGGSGISAGALEALKKQMEEQMAIALEQQKREHEEELKKMRDEVAHQADSAKKDLEEREREIQELKDERSAVLDRSSQLDIELQGKDEQNKSLTDAVANLEARIAAVGDGEEKVKQTQATADALSDEMRAMKEELLRAEAERDELLILVAELDEEREVMKVQFSDLSTIQKGHTGNGTNVTANPDTSIQFE